MVLRSSSMIYPWHLSSYCVNAVSSESRDKILTYFSSYWKNDQEEPFIFLMKCFFLCSLGLRSSARYLYPRKCSKNRTSNPLQGLVYVRDALSPKILVEITKIILFCIIITFLFQPVVLSLITLYWYFYEVSSFLLNHTELYRNYSKKKKRP